MTTDRDHDPRFDSGWPAVDHDHEQASLGEVVGDIADDLQRLFRHEIELAKAEVRQEGSKAAKAGGMFAGATVAALLTAVMVSLALMYALAEIMHIGWAALIIGALWAVAAAVLLSTGRTRLRAVRPLPQTQETIKENAQWPPTRN